MNDTMSILWRMGNLDHTQCSGIRLDSVLRNDPIGAQGTMCYQGLKQGSVTCQVSTLTPMLILQT